MDLKTKGVKSSEFWLLIVVVVGLLGLTVAENVTDWQIDSKLVDLLWGLMPTVGAYALGRSWFKGQKARALGVVEAARLQGDPLLQAPAEKKKGK